MLKIITYCNKSPYMIVIKPVTNFHTDGALLPKAVEKWQNRTLKLHILLKYVMKFEKMLPSRIDVFTIAP